MMSEPAKRSRRLAGKRLAVILCSLVCVTAIIVLVNIRNNSFERRLEFIAARGGRASETCFILSTVTRLTPDPRLHSNIQDLRWVPSFSNPGIPSYEISVFCRGRGINPRYLSFRLNDTIKIDDQVMDAVTAFAHLVIGTEYRLGIDQNRIFILDTSYRCSAQSQGEPLCTKQELDPAEVAAHNELIARYNLSLPEGPLPEWPIGDPRTLSFSVQTC